MIGLRNQADAFFNQKLPLLKQFLDLSENMISRLDDMEVINESLSQREDILKKLADLEKAFDPQVREAISEAQRTQIGQLIGLLLNLDKHIARGMEVEQKKIMSSMQTTQQEKKIFNYVVNQAAVQSGSRLNYKE